MSASIIASFLSFFITGLFTYWVISFDLSIHPSIKWALFLAILSNAFYFFYVEALTESDDDTQDRIRDKKRKEWVLRIINQTLLFSLWFILHWSLLAFAIGLAFLYLLFIYWDIYTGEHKENKHLYYTDIGGFILTVIFSIVTFFAVSGNMNDKEPIEYSAKLYSEDTVKTLVQFSADDIISFTEHIPVRDTVIVNAMITVEEISNISKQKQIMKPLTDSPLQFYWGMCVMLYLLLPIVSLIINKFKLFNSEYWKKEKLI